MVREARLDLDRGWFFSTGPEGDVVLSTQVRLGRNVAGFPFLSLLSGEAKRSIAAAVRAALERCEEDFRVLSHPADPTALLLRERRLVEFGPQHEGELFVRADQGVVVALFDEDHLRITAARSGWNHREALAQARRVAEIIDAALPFAVSLHWGYVGPDPLASGAALRASALMHLPALMDRAEAHQAVAEALAPGVAIKAFRSSCAHSLGNVYLVESAAHPGWSEAKILAELEECVGRLVHYERTARESLLRERREEAGDWVRKSLALLRNATTIRADDAMQLLSWLRLGVALKLTDEIEMEEVTSLLFLSQKSHLSQRGEEPESEDDRRARLLRRSLTARD